MLRTLRADMKDIPADVLEMMSASMPAQVRKMIKEAQKLGMCVGVSPEGSRAK
jgi:hypothetical protein